MNESSLPFSASDLSRYPTFSVFQTSLFHQLTKLNRRLVLGDIFVLDWELVTSTTAILLISSCQIVTYGCIDVDQHGRIFRLHG